MTAGTAARRPAMLGVAAVAAVVLAVCLVLATALGRGNSLGRSPLVGRPAPSFSLATLQDPAGRKVRLEDLRGQVVLVNFWASWCAECVNEQPALNRLWARYRDAGVVIVGVSFQDARGDARDFVERAGTTYPLVVDPRSDAALAYGVHGLPESFLIGADGRVVDRVVGSLDEVALGRRIDRLLDDRT